MERGVETCNLRHAREGFREGPRAAHIKRLVRRLHRRQRVEIVQHVAVDQDWRLETHPPQAPRGDLPLPPWYRRGWLPTTR